MQAVASTEYLKQNNCALCVSTSDEIKACFRSLLEDKDLMKRMGTAALSVAKKNHSREVIENRLYEVLERL